MAQPKAEDDPRLWAVAYVGFFVRNADPKSRKSRQLLESDARYMAKAVGNFAMFLMDSVWLPVHFGVQWTDSWVEIDSLKRTNPPFKAAMKLREGYRRTGMGLSLLPKWRLRRVAGEAVGMLWLAYQAEAGSDGPLLYGSAPIVEMLQRYQRQFGHSSGPWENA